MGRWWWCSKSRSRWKVSTDSGCSRSNSSVARDGQLPRAKEKNPVGRYKRDRRPGTEQPTSAPGCLLYRFQSQQTSFRPLTLGEQQRGRRSWATGLIIISLPLWNHCLPRERLVQLVLLTETRKGKKKGPGTHTGVRTCLSG